MCKRPGASGSFSREVPNLCQWLEWRRCSPLGSLDLPVEAPRCWDEAQERWWRVSGPAGVTGNGSRAFDSAVGGFAQRSSTVVSSLAIACSATTGRYADS